MKFIAKLNARNLKLGAFGVPGRALSQIVTPMEEPH